MITPDFSVASYIFRCTNGGGRIATARDTVLAPYGNSQTLRGWLERMAANHRITVDRDTPGQPVTAFVEYGRWAAKCPVCNGYIDVDPSEPVFLCVSCGEMKLKAVFSPVIFPPDRAQIEAELLKRKNIWNRNWKPGESLADLRTEFLAFEGGEI